ncbi:MAG: hypothetical protein ACE5FT_06635 [Candidatus Nanoarchaeia archaeon]
MGLKNYLAAALIGLAGVLPVQATSYEAQVCHVDSQLTKKNDEKVIDLKIVVDRAWVNRFKGEWWSDIDKAVKFCDRVFRRDLGLGVDVDKVMYHELDSVSSVAYLHNQTIAEIPVGEQDAVVFLSGRFIRGFLYNGNHIFIAKKTGDDLNTYLAHELSHLLGAPDYQLGHPLYHKKDFMSYKMRDKADGWHPDTLRRMREYVGRSWKTDITERGQEYLQELMSKVEPEDKDLARRLGLHEVGINYTALGNDIADRLIKKYPDVIDFHMIKATNLQRSKFKQKRSLKEYLIVQNLMRKQELTYERTAELYNAMARGIMYSGRTEFEGLVPVELAMRASELDPQEKYLDTLGIALFQIQRFDLAFEVFAMQAEAMK